MENRTKCWQTEQCFGGGSGPHASTALAVHDGTLVGNDRLDEDGVEDADEQDGCVEGAHDVENGLLGRSATGAHTPRHLGHHIGMLAA